MRHCLGALLVLVQLVGCGGDRTTVTVRIVDAEAQIHSTAEGQFIRGSYRMELDAAADGAEPIVAVALPPTIENQAGLPAIANLEVDADVPDPVHVHPGETGSIGVSFSALFGSNLVAGWDAWCADPASALS